MKITYKYTNYPFSKSATSWSRFRSSLGATSVVIIILLVLGINLALTNLFGLKDQYIICFGIALAGFIGFLFFCKRREILCAAYDLEKQRRSLDRPLTPEEKKQVRMALKMNKGQK